MRKPALFTGTRRRSRKSRPRDARDSAAAAAALRRIHHSSFSTSTVGTSLSRRRHLLGASRCDDRLSALSDDLLLLILRRLDTRTALATAALSKRWAGLPRWLDALGFRVSDILPSRYHQCIRMHGEASRYKFGIITIANFMVLFASIRRYERRAMRVMAASINSFLDVDDHHDRDGRFVHTLRLECFVTQSSGCVNRLIAKAVDTWGVEDLEVSAKGTYLRQDAHNFPHHGLCNDPHKSRLRSLKLVACYIPPLQGLHALTTLVLQDLPDSIPTTAYVSVFALCPQLQALHLKFCIFNQDVVDVHAPTSGIKQLIIEECLFVQFKMHTLPTLESMSVVETSVIYKLSSFPYLTHLKLTDRYGITRSRMHFKAYMDLKFYLGGTPGITDLIIRLTGYNRWFKVCSSTLLFPRLRRLLVADVPSSWDISWPRLLIEAAPCLESLHIHIAPCEEDPNNDILWQPPQFCHSQLKELVIVGFQGTERQIYFVNFVMKVSTALQLVSLFKNGHVQDKGHWDWYMVTQKYQWGNEERARILNQITDNVPSSPTPVQVVLE